MSFAANAQTSLKGTFVHYRHPDRKPRFCPGKTGDFVFDGPTTGAEKCAVLRLPIVPECCIGSKSPPFSDVFCVKLVLSERQPWSDSSILQRLSCNQLNTEAGFSVRVPKISRDSGNDY